MVWLMQRSTFRKIQLGRISYLPYEEDSPLDHGEPQVRYYAPYKYVTHLRPGPKVCILIDMVQLKCGDAELDKGEKTTDLTKAYVNRKSGELLPHYKKKREPLIQELDLWSKSKLRVLRVLVTAAVGDAGKRAPPAPGLGYGEYYIRCDASKGELMFGPQFTHLLAAVRKGGGDVLEAYRSDSDTYSSKRQRTK